MNRLFTNLSSLAPVEHVTLRSFETSPNSGFIESFMTLNSTRKTTKAPKVTTSLYHVSPYNLSVSNSDRAGFTGHYYG